MTGRGQWRADVVYWMSVYSSQCQLFILFVYWMLNDLRSCFQFWWCWMLNWRFRSWIISLFLSLFMKSWMHPFTFDQSWDFMIFLPIFVAFRVIWKIPFYFMDLIRRRAKTVPYTVYRTPIWWRWFASTSSRSLYFRWGMRPQSTRSNGMHSVIHFHFHFCIHSLAKSYRKSFIESSDGESMTAHKVFCSWDYRVTDEKAVATNKQIIHNELKLILDGVYDSVDIQTKWICFWIWVTQISANVFVFGILGGVGYFIWSLLHVNVTIESIICLNCATWFHGGFFILNL